MKRGKPENGGKWEGGGRSGNSANWESLVRHGLFMQQSHYANSSRLALEIWFFYSSPKFYFDFSLPFVAKFWKHATLRRQKKTALWVGHSSALWPKVANAQRLLFSIDFRHLNRITENPTLLNPHLYLLKTANLRHFSDVNLNGKQIIVRKNNFPFK